MKSFKGFVIRWMANVAELCPWTRHRITAALKLSAEAAVQTCTGGENGRMCGMRWASGTYDGNTGLGQETSVLSALMALLREEDDGHQEHRIVTLDTGGTSLGDPHAGESGRFRKRPRTFGPATRADVIGATILTGLMILGGMAMFVWISIGAHEQPHSARRFREPMSLELQMMPPPSVYCHRQVPIEARGFPSKESNIRRVHRGEVDPEREDRKAGDVDRRMQKMYPAQRVVEDIERRPKRHFGYHPQSRAWPPVGRRQREGHEGARQSTLSNVRCGESSVNNASRAGSHYAGDLYLHRIRVLECNNQEYPRTQKAKRARDLS